MTFNSPGPGAGLWNTFLKPKRSSKGSSTVDLPVFVGPTIMGVRVVLEGPLMMIARNAAASSTCDRVALFSAKNLLVDLAYWHSAP